MPLAELNTYTHVITARESDRKHLLETVIFAFWVCETICDLWPWTSYSIVMIDMSLKRLKVFVVLAMDIEKKKN